MSQPEKVGHFQTSVTTPEYQISINLFSISSETYGKFLTIKFNLNLKYN